nr:porin [Paracoccus saliphilus]
MKKALFASTALVLSAGVAAADVTISGYGRTGVIYYENEGEVGDFNESQVISRLRMNIVGTTSTDQGVDFGGVFRLQWDQNSSSRGFQGELNSGRLYVTASGLTVEVGNVNTAFDSAGLLYATELGSYDRSVGFSSKVGTFFAYDADRYTGQLFGVDTDGDGDVDADDGLDELATYNGVAASYSVAGVNLRASYVDPDQSGLVRDNEELGLSADYTWNDRLELSAAYVKDGAGFEDNDIWFVGARYAVMDNARVGLNYVDASNDSEAEVGNTFALYGDYALADGLTVIEAYVANNDSDDNETDNAFGIGANYDLGGARLGASLQRDYEERVTADMGVRFDF